jgi:hypothetical protein
VHWILVGNGGSILVGRPFAREYARAVPAEYWSSPRFLRTTPVITWVWAGVFAVMTPDPADRRRRQHLQRPERRAEHDLLLGDPILALVGGIFFTKWYPDDVERHATAVAKTAKES